MITAVGLLLYLEARLEAAAEGGVEDLTAQMEETARFVRLIAEAALVAGDEVTMQEARRVAARLRSLGVTAPSGESGFLEEDKSPQIVRMCPRCGQNFTGPSGPLERVGSLLCGDCARELLAGIRM